MVRDLLIRPRRYSELLRSLKGIGTNLLAARLDQLELEGLVENSEQDDAVTGYRLTAKGLSLEPLVLELIRWGLTQTSTSPRETHHQDDWDLLAAKAIFESQRAPRKAITVAVDVEGSLTRLTACRGGLTWDFTEGPYAARFHGTLAELSGMLMSCKKRPKVSGDRSAYDQFLQCFVLPTETAVEGKTLGQRQE